MVKYKIRESTRAKNVSINIDLDGSVEVVKPRGLDMSVVHDFVYKKRGWILRSIQYFKNFNYPEGFDFGQIKRLTKRDYLKNKEEARVLINKRVEHFNQVYNFQFGRVSIKNQKRCWGSCSEKGNLNFNYRLLFLPEHLRDYIIVHELCHLVELNHSRRFWSLVERTVPRHKEIKKELKKEELLLQ